MVPIYCWLWVKEKSPAPDMDGRSRKTNRRSKLVQTGKSPMVSPCFTLNLCNPSWFPMIKVYHFLGQKKLLFRCWNPTSFLSSIPGHLRARSASSGAGHLGGNEDSRNISYIYIYILYIYIVYIYIYIYVHIIDIDIYIYILGLF